MDEILNNVLGTLKETPKKKKRAVEEEVTTTKDGGGESASKPVTTPVDGKENVKPWLWKPDNNNQARQEYRPYNRPYNNSYQGGGNSYGGNSYGGGRGGY
jgi:hypothetical protein